MERKAEKRGELRKGVGLVAVSKEDQELLGKAKAFDEDIGSHWWGGLIQG